MGMRDAGELLARLEALTARLDDQAALLDAQAGRVVCLETANAAQADQIERQAGEIAGLKALPRGAPLPMPAHGAEAKVGRRGMIQKIVGATAAAAVLTVAKEAATAHAFARTTTLETAVLNYGVAASPLTADPDDAIDNVRSSYTAHGVIGVMAGNPGIAPPGHSGVLGQSLSFNGVIGLSYQAVGLWGQSTQSDGVYGTAGGFGVGVHGVGQANGIGVWGEASGRVGIFGSSSGQTGIFGVSKATNPGGTTAPPQLSGVAGQGFGRIGVQGISDTGIGVYGTSTGNHGCGGTSGAAGYSGLFGFTAVPGAAALLGVSGAVSGTAGYFHGAVFVDSSFQVVNGPKNALVAHPDGSHRRMYCQESPEPWFEDFGTATLQGGKATVRLDPDFAAVVKADEYSVVPIPEGECKGLYVTAKTPVSFEVRELQGGTSSIPFGYRLVARRKDDVGRRMEKVDLPRFDLTDPSTRGTPASHAGGGRPAGTER